MNKLHSLRVGLTCIPMGLVGLALVCVCNRVFGDWAAGFFVPLAVVSALTIVLGAVHVVIWVDETIND